MFEEHARRKHEAEELQVLKDIRRLEGQQVLILSDIRSLLKQKSILTQARIIVMPKQIEVGQTAQAVVQGFDQNGGAFPLDATYSVVPSGSNPSNATFSAPAPDGSFVATGVAVDPGDVIGASITRPDGVVIQAATDTLTIVPVPLVLTTAKVVLQ